MRQFEKVKLQAVIMQSSKDDISGFLRLCAKYAQSSIARKIERGAAKDEINSWQTYLKYTKYTIAEIENGSLDHWMSHLASDDWTPMPSDNSTPLVNSPHVAINSSADSIDPNGLEFIQRMLLINGLIGPRPLALASTKSREGIDNLAGITSISVVSNNPPLLTISLSQYLDSRPRDTLVNLQENGKITLHILPPTLEMAYATDAASKPLPRTESEWDSLDYEMMESPSGEEWPVLFPNSIAAIECELLEVHDLPKGAVAKLCILQINKIIAPKQTIDNLAAGGSIATLCQHRTLRIGPSPTSWSHLCDINPTSS